MKPGRFLVSVHMHAQTLDPTINPHTVLNPEQVQQDTRI